MENEFKYFFGALGMYMGFIVWCYDGTTDALEKCENLGGQIRYIHNLLQLEHNPNQKFEIFRKITVPKYAAELSKVHSWKEYLEYQDPILLLG